MFSEKTLNSFWALSQKASSESSSQGEPMSATCNHKNKKKEITKVLNWKRLLLSRDLFLNGKTFWIMLWQRNTTDKWTDRRVWTHFLISYADISTRVSGGSTFMFFLFSVSLLCIQLPMFGSWRSSSRGDLLLLSKQEFHVIDWRRIFRLVLV